MVVKVESQVNECVLDGNENTMSLAISEALSRMKQIVFSVRAMSRFNKGMEVNEMTRKKSFSWIGSGVRGANSIPALRNGVARCRAVLTFEQREGRWKSGREKVKKE